MNRKYLLGGMVGVGLLAATASVEAAVIQTSLKLTDASGAELTKEGDVYQVSVGTKFNVVLIATVQDPNPTDQGRSNAALRGQPLGIQNLTLDIVTQGAGRVTPVGVPGTNPPQWEDDAIGGVYQDLTPDGVGYPFVNLLDRNGDGNLDVAGAGFNHQGFSLATTGALPRFQYGATGPMEILQGDFVANQAGLVTMRTVAGSANLYMDPTTGGVNDVAAVDALSNLVDGSIQIQVIGAVGGESTIGLGTTGNGGTAITLNITGANHRYVSNTVTPATPVAKGTVDVSAIGPEGDVLVMIQFTDTDPANGPALDQAFLSSIQVDGGTLLAANSPEYLALAAHYGLLTAPQGNLSALFRLQGSNRILNFDFSAAGGIAVASIAAVPEPGIIGALAVGGFGLLARRRRHA